MCVDHLCTRELLNNELNHKKRNGYNNGKI